MFLFILCSLFYLACINKQSINNALLTTLYLYSVSCMTELNACLTVLEAWVWGKQASAVFFSVNSSSLHPDCSTNEPLAV